MSYIIEVHARQILDSRGNPTVEVDVLTDDGAMTPLLVLILHNKQRLTRRSLHLMEHLTKAN